MISDGLGLAPYGVYEVLVRVLAIFPYACFARHASDTVHFVQFPLFSATRLTVQRYCFMASGTLHFVLIVFLFFWFSAIFGDILTWQRYRFTGSCTLRFVRLVPFSPLVFFVVILVTGQRYCSMAFGALRFVGLVHFVSLIFFVSF